MSQIADKDAYHQLTDKQKAVVDELVNDPTAQNTLIADRAGVSRSTVYNVKEHYGEIVESQLNQHGRYDGEETTDGDPFDGELEFERASQLIQDRPVQDDDSVEVEATGEERRVSVSITERDARAVLTDGDCERVRAAVLEAVVGKAFNK